MALIKRVYKDQETVITAENLNDIQDAVIALEDGLFSIDNEKSGEAITITDAANRGFRSLNIYGKTTQDGTPTPDAPVDLVNIGAGGSITVNVTGDNDAQSMTIATPNGLPGIPVSSGGNYTDASGQQWICDEIDFARGAYIQRTKKIAINGSADENWRISTVQAVTGATRFDSWIGAEPRASRMFCLCNAYAGTDAPNSRAETIWCNNEKTVSNLQFRICTASVSTIEELKVSLQANPTELIYTLADPIETPLSKEELAAYAALHTYKDHTTVSNDAGAWMDLEYAMDAKKYIDKLSGGANAARLGSVTLLASAWVGSGNLYSQVVAIDGITEYSQVNLTPTVEQMATFYEKDITFITENDGGVVTVYVIGQKPQNDYTIQANIVEVSV